MIQLSIPSEVGDPVDPVDPTSGETPSISHTLMGSM